MKKSLNSIVIAACLIFTAATIIDGVAPIKYDIKVGDTCPVDLYAPRSVVDKAMTEKQKETAAAAVEPQYELDNNITLEAERNLANLFNEIEKARGGNSSSFKSEYCTALTETEYQSFKSTVTDVHQGIITKGVKDVDESLNDAREQLRSSLHNEDAVNAALDILRKTLEVNKIYSETKTNEAIEHAKEQVQSVTYKKDQVIVRRGDIITQSQYGVLSELGLIKGNESSRLWQMAGAIIFVLMCFAIVSLYVSGRRSKHIFTPKIRAMAAIITFLAVLMALLGKSDSFDEYLIPLAAGSILLAVLTEVKFALLLNTVIAVTASVTIGGDAFYFASMFISGCMGIYLYSNVSQRSSLVFSSILLCASNAVVFFALSMLQGVEIKEGLLRAISGVGSGVISSILVMGTLPVWENVFDIVTPFRLTELANPNQPLLKRLLLEAPGTYHHSLMVGNLAEAACEALGGNYLLARTGAYYHDVGKIAHPDMFTENQYGINPHDALPPEESAEIIINHVKDGLRFAKEYKLPEAISRIILTHHGKSRVAFFYHRAKELGGEVDERLFTYDGDYPRTREEAVVMLADSTEAAVRSLDIKSEDEIDKMIEKIIRMKLDDGQLAHCSLNLNEIEIIKETFAKVFGGYFHTRIKYPDDDK